MPRSIWSRLFGRERDSDLPPIFDLFQEADPRHLGFGLQFFVDRTRPTRDEAARPAADPGVASVPIPPAFAIGNRIDTASGFTALIDRHPLAVDLVAPVWSLGATPAADLVDSLVTLPSDPHHGAEAGDDRVFRVQVEWPWMLAFGLMPIGPDSASEAKREPNGWVENLLDQQAQLSPLTVAFAADSGAIGDPPNWETWAGPALGSLELSGDFSAGFTLTAQSFDVDRMTLSAGSDYNLAANDNFVATGETLVIDATELGAEDGVIFDGAEETDGRFLFIGSDSDDFFFGGAGDDRIEGRGGADALSGGGGSDVFVYGAPSDSTGIGYDTIADFDPATDRIDVRGAVPGFGDPVLGGGLSHASFNDDLAAALGNLGAGQAVWFAPDSGDLAGQIFLIIDGNGQAGYQDGEDFVIAIGGAPLADLTGHPDIFI